VGIAPRAVEIESARRMVQQLHYLAAGKAAVACPLTTARQPPGLRIANDPAETHSGTQRKPIS
jgi:hypothetical protein